MFTAPERIRMDTMVAAETAGRMAIARGEVEFDITAMTDVDSSAIALLLSWQRTARAGALTLSFRGAGSAVLDLAELYGVTDILQLRSAN